MYSNNTLGLLLLNLTKYVMFKRTSAVAMAVLVVSVALSGAGAVTLGEQFNTGSSEVQYGSQDVGTDKHVPHYPGGGGGGDTGDPPPDNPECEDQGPLSC
jgi:hypothetical protein